MYLYYLIALARYSRPTLNTSGNERYSYCVSSFNEKAFSVSVSFIVKCNVCFYSIIILRCML